MGQAAKELGHPGEKLRYIPWGVETELFSPAPMDQMETRMFLGIDPDAKVILSPRGIASVYNQDVLLEAITDLTGRFPSLILLLLRYNADPEVTTRLEAMVAGLNLQQQVRWLPPQTPSEMARLYRMADVVVSIPSSDGYGFSVYEAMAAGCPTLISDVPVFADELIDGVHTLKVPVHNTMATRQRLAELLDDATLRQTLRQQAFDVIQDHSIAERVAKTEALYTELLGAP
jgi:glycosyltransferase involved in cell wall biosynthesis